MDGVALADENRCNPTTDRAADRGARRLQRAAVHTVSLRGTRAQQDSDRRNPEPGDHERKKSDHDDGD